MLRSILIGLAAGARSMTPLAAVSDAAKTGALPRDNGAPDWLGNPLVAAGTKLLAAGELAGDKMKTAPDRIVPAGIAARLLTAGIAGAALAPRRHRYLGAVLAATSATVSAYVTFNARMYFLRRYGQSSTGLIEDALTVAATQAVLLGAGPTRR